MAKDRQAPDNSYFLQETLSEVSHDGSLYYQELWQSFCLDTGKARFSETAGIHLHRISCLPPHIHVRFHSPESQPVLHLHVFRMLVWSSVSFGKLCFHNSLIIADHGFIFKQDCGNVPFRQFFNVFLNCSCFWGSTLSSVYVNLV